MPKLKGLAAGFCLVVANTLAAGAHPHAWITTRAAAIFDDTGRVTAISIDWTFDKDYSSYAIEGLDADGNGQFSPSELAVLVEENIKALKEYDYFVYPRAGDAQLSWGEVSEYGISRNEDERLEMQFVIPLAAPIDPRQVEFSFKIYDPTFYIDIQFPDDDPLSVIGPLPGGCRLALLPPPSDAQVEATRSMLASKPKDWQPDTSEDFGGMFAQPAKIDCKAKAQS